MAALLAFAKVLEVIGSFPRYRWRGRCPRTGCDNFETKVYGKYNEIPQCTRCWLAQEPHSSGQSRER
jgi:hypothetical protein